MSAVVSRPGGADLVESLKGLGLTSLAKVVPGVLETARHEQWPYETFLAQAVGAEVQGRAWCSSSPPSRGR